MPENQSIERRQTMKAFGAELVLTSQEGSMELARDFYRDIGLRNKAKLISMKIAKDSPSFETNRELAMDLLVLGNTKRFFGFAKKKNLINNEVHAKYFDDLISKGFAMNLSKPLNQSWRSLSVQYKVFEHFNDPTFNKFPSEIDQDTNQLPWSFTGPAFDTAKGGIYLGTEQTGPCLLVDTGAFRIIAGSFWGNVGTIMLSC